MAVDALPRQLKWIENTFVRMPCFLCCMNVDFNFILLCLARDSSISPHFMPVSSILGRYKGFIDYQSRAQYNYRYVNIKHKEDVFNI